MLSIRTFGKVEGVVVPKKGTPLADLTQSVEWFLQWKNGLICLCAWQIEAIIFHRPRLSVFSEHSANLSVAKLALRVRFRTFQRRPLGVCVALKDTAQKKW